eukprot:23182-Pelagomonas_calceolata.AAC.1
MQELNAGHCMGGGCSMPQTEMLYSVWLRRMIARGQQFWVSKACLGMCPGVPVRPVLLVCNRHGSRRVNVA